MTFCNDRRRHERHGEDDARRDPGRRFDHDYRERERSARYEPHGCDAAYIRGFEDQRRRDDEEREQREHDELIARLRAAREQLEAEAELGPDDGEDPFDDDPALTDECAREDREFYGRRDTDD